MGKAQPTQDGLRAAQEALERNPTLVGNLSRDQALVILAHLHDDFGNDRFRLLYGLRSPATFLEFLAVEQHSGRITMEEFRERGDAHVNRAVDGEMLRIFYHGLEERIVAYGNFLSYAVTECLEIERGSLHWWNEPRMEQLLMPMRRKFTLSSQELLTAVNFSSEVRIERGMGLLQLGKYTEPSAATAAVNLRGKLERFWGMATGRADFQSVPLPPDRAYNLLTSGQFPSASDLQAYLRAENAAARLVLLERSKPVPPPSPVSIHALNCDLVAGTVNLKSEAPASSTTKLSSALKRLKLQRWTDLAIGEQLLHALARRHDTSAARIDTSVFNPSRIAKLPGTWSRKGDPLPDRPHRLCRVVAVPDEYRVVRKEQLAAIVAEYPLTASRTLPCATTKATDPGEKSKRSDGTRREDRCVVLCRAYLAKLPPAVAGKHGSDRTFEAARIIWNDFAIDEAEGWPMLCEWNRKCLPPWPEEGGSQCLRRKWNEAVAKGGDQRGCKVRGSDSTRSDSSAEARDQSPTGQPQAGAGIILDYFRDTYGPVFRRGNAVHCHDGRDVPMSEACTVTNSRLIESLMAATDAPRLRNGDIHRQAIPAFFRTWSKVAWGDLLAALPDEDDAVIGNDAPACEEFRRLVREALFSEVVLGDTLTQATELTRTERRSLIDWCNKFAKTGPWRDIRSKRCWCRCLEKPGGELKLQVAIRHEIFAQLKADRRLSEMGSKKFTRRAARYGVGTSTPTFRPHGFNAIVLDQDFIDDLICGLPNENEPLES